MRVMIIDDEQAMLTVMKRMLGKIDGIAKISCYQQIEEAVAAARIETVDLAFVDIKIARENGLELARRLREIHNGMDIVFVTSHKEFAIDSFDMYPLDYMVKPVSRDRLKKTIARAAARLEAGGHQAAAAAVDSDKLSVRGFGGLDVRNTAGGEVRWRSTKSTELFAYLLLFLGRPVSKSRIIEDVFPHMPLENARTYLKTAVYQLRQALLPHGLKNVVVSSHEQYRLSMERLEVDFVQFGEDVSVLNVLDDNNIQAAMDCAERYVGDIYEDKSYLWVTAEQARLAGQYTDLAKRIIRWLMEHGKYAQAMPIAIRLVTYNELDEEAASLLLRMYRAANDLQAMKRYYMEFCSRHQQELGVPVSARFMADYHSLIDAASGSGR